MAGDIPAMELPRLVVFSDHLPFAPGEPGSPRLFCFLRELSTSFSIMLVTRNPEEKVRALLSGSGREQIRVTSIYSLPAIPKPSSAGKLVHRIVGRSYLNTSLRTPAYHRFMQRQVANCLSDIAPSAILLVGMDYGQYLPAKSSIPTVVDLVDELSLLIRKDTASDKNIFRRFKYWRECRALLREQGDAVRRGTVGVLISQRDRESLHNYASDLRLEVVENGIDTTHFTRHKPLARGSSVGFFGVMDYKPNVDAVTFYVSEIHPRVREAIPDSKFVILGKSPSAEVERLASIPGVVIRGYVKDLPSELESIQVFVCPLRAGAGVKNKVLQALSMELPSVLSAEANSGINARDGFEAIVCEEPVHYVTAIVSLLSDYERAINLGESGKTFVKARFSWQRSGEKLHQLLTSNS